MNRFLIILCIFCLLIHASAFATIAIEKTNATTIGLYEKFEVIYNLDDFSYDNPYNPLEIDVYAIFTAPSGKEWRMFGFYDDYENADDWKLRFSPNEVGEWSYIIFANGGEKFDQTAAQTFTVEASDNKGWIKISQKNPHYFEHDNGDSFYGVGMYMPWQNSVERFDEMHTYGGNTFAIWNITYGGMTNGYGLIEEELGVYNQEKCGKIDELLEVSEERDLKCMYCFWPHDLFSDTVWAHQWHLNPYNTICDVENVYSDSLCWEYQTRQYRYLIARYSYSRSLAIWEMMNEINGTDGWAAGKHDEAEAWVQKVHDYFHANDPYEHPTTASRSGGYTEYWPEMYEITDVPNIHVYETQGWPMQYGSDPLRSSSYNYAFAAKRFWDSFNKPGIFGEAGADLVNVETHSEDYTKLYHNAIWACLTNGNATTPYWWAYHNPITDDEREQMQPLANFVQDINFIKDAKNLFSQENNNFDLYGIQGDSSAFAWIRQANGMNISGRTFELKDVLNADVSAFAVHYYDTWTGKYLQTHIRPYVDGLLHDTIPVLSTSCADVAFKLAPAEGGETPTRIELYAKSLETLNIDTLQTPITCYLFDDQNRFCSESVMDIHLELQGSGNLSATEMTTIDGAASFSYTSANAIGDVKIIASASGMAPDTLVIHIMDKKVVDDFESYGSLEELHNEWLALNESKADISLATSPFEPSTQCMQLDYAIGSDYKMTAVIEKKLDHSFAGGNFLTFWLQPDNSNREIEIRIFDINNKYWYYRIPLTGSEPRSVCLPLEAFSARDKTIPFDLSILSAMRFTVRKSSAEYGSGTIFIDDIQFPETAPTVVQQQNPSALPTHFSLQQNYPNPFNMQTRIVYSIPQKTHVNISIYNCNGRLVETLQDAEEPAGTHEIAWNSADKLASGIYFYRLQAGAFKSVRKCLLTK